MKGICDKGEAREEDSLLFPIPLLLLRKGKKERESKFHFIPFPPPPLPLVRSDRKCRCLPHIVSGPLNVEGKEGKGEREGLPQSQKLNQIVWKWERGEERKERSKGHLFFSLSSPGFFIPTKHT